MAYGAGGMLAGFAFQKGRLPVKPWCLAIFGFFAVMLWVGPLLDVCALFLTPMTYTLHSVVGIFISGAAVNIFQACSTVLVMLLFGKPLLDKLDRIKVKYGMLEADDGV